MPQTLIPFVLARAIELIPKIQPQDFDRALGSDAILLVIARGGDCPATVLACGGSTWMITPRTAPPSQR
jgi:hypothetical protein